MMHILKIQGDNNDLQPCFFTTQKNPLFIQMYPTVTIKILYLTVKRRKSEIVKQTNKNQSS